MPDGVENIMHVIAHRQHSLKAGIHRNHFKHGSVFQMKTTEGFRIVGVIEPSEAFQLPGKNAIV
ncbi:hypothetical protein D3C83_158370 [compost metagenome]